MSSDMGVAKFDEEFLLGFTIDHHLLSGKGQ